MIDSVGPNLRALRENLYEYLMDTVLWSSGGIMLTGSDMQRERTIYGPTTTPTPCCRI